MSLYALKPYIANLTRSSLHQCFQRHNVSRLPSAENHGTNTPKKSFKYYPVGYIHIDITQAYTQQGKIYLFVAIDRTCKYTYVELHDNQTSLIATIFLKNLIKNTPNKIHTILTDNGLQFCNGNKINRSRSQVISSENFHSTCNQQGIKHKQTLAYHTWTNGQVERMNRTIKQATVDTIIMKV